MNNNKKNENLGISILLCILLSFGIYFMSKGIKKNIYRIIDDRVELFIKNNN